MNSNSLLIQKIDASIQKKLDLFDHFKVRYIFRAVMACMFLALGTAVAFAIAIKGEEIAHGLGKILYSFMFSWALVMIVYMNAELGTSNMMYMTVGVYQKRLSVIKGMKILLVCIFFNLIGGVLVGFLLAQTGAFQQLPADCYLFEAIAAKLDKGTLQIVIEGIFANIVVNTAVVISMRMKDYAGKVMTIVFVIFIFAFLGYEHVIANFPAFSLAYFASGGMDGFTISAVTHNLLFALIGNYLGGGLVIGLGYAWANRAETSYLD